MALRLQVVAEHAARRSVISTPSGGEHNVPVRKCVCALAPWGNTGIQGGPDAPVHTITQMMVG